MATSAPKRSEILVMGAGLAGLAASGLLQNSGKEVRIAEKGHGVGGRMATRRAGDATFDHGAQFITARSARFSNAIRVWEEAGIAESWCKGFSAEADGHTRWRGKPSMTAIPKHLSRDLSIELETEVVSLDHDGTEWRVVTRDGREIFAKIMIMTAPVPQSLALIDIGNFRLEHELRQQLEGLDYERCIAVMATLAVPSLVPAPGGFAPGDGPISWIADNQKKGISARPAVTIHGTDSFSLSHWAEDREKAGLKLIEAARSWLGGTPESFQVHGWKYSKPKTVFPEACVVAHQKPLLILAGDAFGGPKVEGAALSGWAAAETVLNHS